jgi:hypothetical protein
MRYQLIHKKSGIVEQCGPKHSIVSKQKWTRQGQSAWHSSPLLSPKPHIGRETNFVSTFIEFFIYFSFGHKPPNPGCRSNSLIKSLIKSLQNVAPLITVDRARSWHSERTTTSPRTQYQDVASMWISPLFIKAGSSSPCPCAYIKAARVQGPADLGEMVTQSKRPQRAGQRIQG